MSTPDWAKPILSTTHEAEIRNRFRFLHKEACLTPEAAAAECKMPGAFEGWVYKYPGQLDPWAKDEGKTFYDLLPQEEADRIVDSLLAEARQ